jgi:hypothetical protein
LHACSFQGKAWENSQYWEPGSRPIEMVATGRPLLRSRRVHEDGAAGGKGAAAVVAVFMGGDLCGDGKYPPVSFRTVTVP